MKFDDSVTVWSDLPRVLVEPSISVPSQILKINFGHKPATFLNLSPRSDALGVVLRVAKLCCKIL